MMFPTFLLDDRPTSGTLALSRALGPPRAAAIVGSSIEALRDAISGRCEWWGGAGHILLPAGAFETEAATPWRTLADESQPDGWEYVHCEPAHAPARLWRHGRLVPTAAIVASIAYQGQSKKEDLDSVHIPVLDEDDPWFLAYLATLGTLPNAPGAQRLQLTMLRDDVTYEELIGVERVVVTGSPADLLERVGPRAPLSPVILSLLLLAQGQEPAVRSSDQILTIFGIERIAPTRTVVVYTPGRVEDACLIWNLRALGGWSAGGPLAVPSTVDVAATVREWEGADAFRFGSMMDTRCALVSASLPEAELRDLARQLGDPWTTIDLSTALRRWQPPARASREIVAMEDGSGDVATWSSEDLRELGRNLSSFGGLGMVARLRPTRAVLPPSGSLETSRTFSNGSFHLGSFSTDAGEPRSTVSMRWPTGWTVLRSFARDRGLEVRPSAPGRAGEALVRRMGGLGELWALNGPEVVSVLTALSERHGMSWTRNRWRAFTAGLSEIVGRERFEQLEARVLQHETVMPDDDPNPRVIPLSGFDGIGERAAVASWVVDAEDLGLLLRGVDVECDACRAISWFATSEFAEPLTCRGCGERIRHPFGPDVLQFHYRISETLRRVLEHDSLGHLLTLRWLAELFSVGTREAQQLVGGYPGVSFSRSGQEIGEADVLLLFADGTCAVGEYKRAGVGLNAVEVGKLDRLADAVGADWTFTATHETASTCPPIWRECQRRPPDRPHFSITGDRLYRHALWLYREDPFEYPDSDTQYKTEVHDPALASLFSRERRHPDVDLHDGWRREDEHVEDSD